MVTTDTVEMFQHHSPIPIITQSDCLQKAVVDILTILQNTHQLLPFQSPTESQTDAIVKIATMLKRAKKKPKPILSPPPIDPPE